jgi:SAM-dependent methyltransferase
MKSRILSIVQNKIPPQERLRMRKQFRRLSRPALLGTLRRTTPLSYSWGIDRGQPVDRYYIERFLESYSKDIRGNVLEIKDSGYTNRFGRGVLQRDVLDIDSSNPLATFVADLARAEAIPAESFDCFIITQTLQFILDLRAAAGHCHRILRPGGVLLATVPVVSRIDRALASVDYWRFTTASCLALFGEVFGLENVTVQAHGNVLTAIAFLSGMAREELSRRELEANDQYFPIIITVRAVKAA